MTAITYHDIWDWTELVPGTGFCRVKDNAPMSIKKKAKTYDDEEFAKTGRHALIIDFEIEQD